ncbi:MAG: hypothetical protein ABJO72_07500 [Hyphomicrobiales bacterium]
MTSIKNRYVVSAPRSGLNWLRFCVEKLYGIPTPGKKILIDPVDDAEIAFTRSHDPLCISKRKTGRIAWRKIEVEDTANAKTLLILRDPLEVFVRMANKRFKPFRVYLGNLHFFSQAKGERLCIYYEDLISNPETMYAALKFLDLPTAEKFEGIDGKTLDDNWEQLNTQSRELYDKNQVRGGGSKTKLVTDKFTHHQKSLTQNQKLKVWYFLKQELTVEELKLLVRYQPPYLDNPLSVWQKCRLLFWRLNWLD